MQNSIHFEMSYKFVFIKGHRSLCSFCINLPFLLCEYRKFMEGVFTFHHKMCFGL